MQAAVDEWLRSDVFYGESKFDDKEDVKKLILNPRHKRWDSKRKLWGSTSMWDARRLVYSKIWTPLGIDERWMPVLIDGLEARIAAAEKDMQIKAAATSEKKRSESTPAQQGPSWQERQKLLKDRERGVRDCEPEEKRRCAELGLEEAVVLASIDIDSVGAFCLGPKAGLSASGRVLRLVRLEENAARVLGDDPAARVRALVEALKHGEAPAATKKATEERQAKRARREEAPQTVQAVQAEVVTKRALPQTGPIKLARGECGKCARPVSLQFLCCGCVGKPWIETWVHCRDCDALVNPLLRGCPHTHK